MVRKYLPVIVTGVESVAEIFKVVILLIELSWVDMNLLNDPSEVILFSDNLVSRLKLSQLNYSLLVLKFTHIHFWCKLNLSGA